MKEIKIYRASDLEQLLRNRFCPPEFAFIPQVRSGTGYVKQVRTADALVMGLYPSRGLHLSGFEIKVRRNDLMTELKNPDKAEEIAQFCDFWWIVAPKDIVKIEELPVNWGLMIPFGNTVKIVKEAKLLNAVNIDKLLLASILRKAQEIVVPEAKLHEEYERGYKEGQERSNQHHKYEIDQYNELKKVVFDFEKSIGQSLSSWNNDRLKEAIQIVLKGEHLRIKEELNRLLYISKNIVTSIEKELSNE